MSNSGPIPHTAADAARLAEFCARHRVRALRVFGSVLRDDFGPDSDIDVLLEFQPGVDPGLLELGGMQQDLTDLFGREVDLKTPQMLSPANLRRVVASSLLGYAA
jgi:predicted nucleotidyltransferase